MADLDAAVFEPTPRDTACTQQFGGPEKATVTGTFRGEPIDAIVLARERLRDRPLGGRVGAARRSRSERLDRDRAHRARACSACDAARSRRRSRCSRPRRAWRRNDRAARHRRPALPALHEPPTRWPPARRCAGRAAGGRRCAPGSTCAATARSRPGRAACSRELVAPERGETPTTRSGASFRARASSRSAAATRRARASRARGTRAAPEARGVVHHLEVADLVLDDVVEHRLGREQQPPVERHRAARRARRPARALAADRQAVVGHARAGHRGVEPRRRSPRARRGGTSARSPPRRRAGTSSTSPRRCARVRPGSGRA